MKTIIQNCFYRVQSLQLRYTQLLSAIIILNENPSPGGEQLCAGSGALRLLWLYPVFAFTGRVKVVRNNKHSDQHSLTQSHLISIVYINLYNYHQPPLLTWQTSRLSCSSSPSPREDLSSPFLLLLLLSCEGSLLSFPPPSPPPFLWRISPLSSSSPMKISPLISCGTFRFYFIPVRPDFTPSSLVEKLIFREMSIKSQSPSPARTRREELLVMKSTPSSVWC